MSTKKKNCISLVDFYLKLEFFSFVYIKMVLYVEVSNEKLPFNRKKIMASNELDIISYCCGVIN